MGHARARAAVVVVLVAAAAAVGLGAPPAAAEGRNDLVGSATEMVGNEADHFTIQLSLTLEDDTVEGDTWHDDGTSTATVSGSFDTVQEGNVSSDCHRRIEESGSYSGSAPPFIDAPRVNLPIILGRGTLRYEVNVVRSGQRTVTYSDIQGAPECTLTDESTPINETDNYLGICGGDADVDDSDTITLVFDGACTGTLTSLGKPPEPLVVNTTSDDGDSNPGNNVCDTAGAGQNCSLRAAIQEANAGGGTGTITFDIPGGGIPTIAPVADLEGVEVPLDIDATTQPGGRVRLVGTSAPDDAIGLQIYGGDSTVRGFRVGGFAYGIVLGGAPGSVVVGNEIGVGAGVTPNRRGIIISSAGHRVGGQGAANANDIRSKPDQSADEDLDGVGVYVGQGAVGTEVVGNQIHNSKIGVVVGRNSADTVVGGPTTNHSNAIGQNEIGVLAVGKPGEPLNGLRIYSNTIGGTAEGDVSSVGVLVAGNARDVHIGAEDRINLIGGNVIGVLVYGAPDVTVERNALKAFASSGTAMNGIGVFGVDADGLVVAENVLENIADVFLRGGRGLTVEANKVTHHGTAEQPLGVGVTDATGVRILDNVVDDMAYGILVDRSKDVTIEGGVATRNQVGLDVRRSIEVDVEHVFLDDNELGLSVRSGGISDPRFPKEALDEAADEFAVVLGADRTLEALEIAEDVTGVSMPPARTTQHSTDVTVTESRIIDNETGAVLEALTQRVRFGRDGADDSNTVLRNRTTGVAIVGPFQKADRLRIGQNEIERNGNRPRHGLRGMNVDVGPDGVTPFGRPTLSEAAEAGSKVKLSGKLVGKPSTKYEIDIYRAAACGASRQGEAVRFVKSLEVETNGNGTTPFTTTASKSAMDVFTALASPVGPHNGSSGELAKCEAAT